MEKQKPTEKIDFVSYLPDVGQDAVRYAAEWAGRYPAKDLVSVVVFRDENARYFVRPNKNPELFGPVPENADMVAFAQRWDETTVQIRGFGVVPEWVFVSIENKGAQPC